MPCLFLPALFIHRIQDWVDQLINRSPENGPFKFHCFGRYVGPR